jgi:hypothetical protein
VASVIALPDPPTTGPDLRLRRVARRVRLSAVARCGGWSRQRVTAIEASALPTRRSVERYLDALDRAAADR